MMEHSKYDELCRLCATKSTMVLAINIFENEGAIRQISKKIDTCLPVKVHEQDCLPKMICENCLYKLELFSDFRERSARTERLLVELYKEIATTRAQQPCLVPVDNHELVLVQSHHPLLADHSLRDVSEIDLSSLEHRGGIIVDHEIILTHQNVHINSTALDIDLSNHDLNQDHSNQSLHGQEVAIVDSVSEAQYAENLSLMQHQLLTDQFRLQQELQLSISDDHEASLPVEHMAKPNPLQDPDRYSLEKIDSQDVCNISYEHTKLSIDDMQSNSGLNDMTPKQLEYHPKDGFKHEDSNSGHSFKIEQNQISDADKIIYNMKVDNDNSVSNIQKQWYYCNLCCKSYEQRCAFEDHYEKHFHKCELCMALFTSLDVLNTHRKEAHGSCNTEQKEVPKKQSYGFESDSGIKSDHSDIEHDSEHGNEGEGDINSNNDNKNAEEDKKTKCSPKICKECGKSYKTNYKLAEHMRKHTGEKPYKCKSCEKAFRSKIGLAQHEAKHTGQYSYSCSTCGKGFQCKSYLMVHQRVHSTEKPFPCTTCGQNFKTKQSLLDHTNRHLGVKPYMCDLCGKGFITKGLCRAHQKIHSGQDNRKYSCKICNKMFVSKSYLQTHSRIHTGEKPFMCEVCGKGFLTRVDLKIHSTMHTGEKSYVCEMCGKAFARRDALRCHRRSHTGERPYSCEVCGQTFTQFTPMAIHKRLHTGERPYACETCGKTFVSRSTMMSHAKKHVR
ncbi:unnamed protein product [Acanthoscelides obtectus]|uniref:Uncharacterized protein n=2 Tax=Acanthoscelides obtectus TaxID=200917 RepID=A0A9P0KYU1_ACAOB|nr:unnamed protein product [Acanthoscelides obtectus]CAK1660046.1 Zinc finger protein 235 [Acanthoscelides obtectus]